MTQNEIRKIAESVGFWGVDSWWKHNLPRFETLLSDQAKVCADAFLKEYETISLYTYPDGRDHLWRTILNAKPDSGGNK